MMMPAYTTSRRAATRLDANELFRACAASQVGPQRVWQSLDPFGVSYKSGELGKTATDSDIDRAKGGANGGLLTQRHARWLQLSDVGEQLCAFYGAFALHRWHDQYTSLFSVVYGILTISFTTTKYSCYGTNIEYTKLS